MTTATRTHCKTCRLPFGIVEPHADAPANCTDCTDKLLPIARPWEARIVQCEDCERAMLASDSAEVRARPRSLFTRRVCKPCSRSARYQFPDDEDEE